jgi:hypothetical protein
MCCPILSSHTALEAEGRAAGAIQVLTALQLGGSGKVTCPVGTLVFSPVAGSDIICPEGCRVIKRDTAQQQFSSGLVASPRNVLEV